MRRGRFIPVFKVLLPFPFCNCFALTFPLCICFAMTSQFSWQPLAKLCNDFSIFFAAPGQAVGWCWAGGCERTCWVPGKLLNSIIIIIFSKSIIVIIIELHAPNSQNSRLVLFEFSLCWILLGKSHRRWRILSTYRRKSLQGYETVRKV